MDETISAGSSNTTIGAPADARLSQWRSVLPLATAILLGAGALFALVKFGEAIMVLILSITIADALDPPARWVQRWTKKRVYAAALLYVLLVASFAAVLYWLAPVFMEQSTALSKQLPDMLTTVQQKIHALPNTVAEGAKHAIMNSIAALSSMPMRAAKGLFDAVLIVFLSFYWLIAAPDINQFLRSLFPQQEHDFVDSVRREMSHAMGGYIRGVCIDAVLTGALAWAGLELVGVPYAPVLGVITAVGEFIPYLGPILTAIPAVLMGFLVSPTTALFALLVYTAVLQIESHIIAPNVMRTQTDIPQALVIIALFAGGAVGGLLGLLVAVPSAGAGKVIVERVVTPWLHKRYRQVHEMQTETQ